jgi:hypothetical protein
MSKQVDLVKQFVPKYKREKVLNKLNEQEKLKKLYSKFKSKIPDIQCHICNEFYSTTCKCSRRCRKCPNGHEWYFCLKHGIRVNEKFISTKHECGNHEIYS